MPTPRNRPLRVVMVSAELESFARTGGLGDMVEALSRALGERGLEVIVVSPLYGVTKVPAGASWWWSPVVAPIGWGAGGVRELGVLEVRVGAARVCLLANEALFGSRAGIYGDARGTFGDNDVRFAALSRGALSVAESAWPDTGPDVIHAHDWHAALAVIYPKLVMGDAWRGRPTVLTIHNLGYQGVFGAERLDVLGLPREAFVRGWLRHDGNVNLMKGAIELTDRVTAVSPTYAREILRPDEGYGLDTHLRWHASKLSGIVNGIDTESFDPATDATLARRFSARDAGAVEEAKRTCKAALLAEVGLDGDVGAPLFASVSRLTGQKGIDLVLDMLPALVDRGARLLLVGQGDSFLERGIAQAAARYPGRVASRVAFDPRLARRIFAGSDFLLVPSRYEPCGLTQMYAMRYGSIPIVTPVGGLHDTVAPIDLARGTGTGIVASAADPAALLIACEDALAAYSDPIARREVIARAMARDSSWRPSAEAYVRLYESLLG